MFVSAILVFDSPISNAKYVETVFGSDSARVAKPICKVTGLQPNIAFNDGDTGSYRFSVSNTENGTITEVRYSYVIRVTVPDNSRVLPTSLYVASNNLYSSVSQVQESGTQNGNVYTYSANTMVFNNIANSYTHYYQLMLSESDVGMEDIVVSVVVTQKDA